MDNRYIIFVVAVDSVPIDVNVDIVDHFDVAVVVKVVIVDIFDDFDVAVVKVDIVAVDEFLAAVVV